MLSVTCKAECHYAECHYNECHYAECHYAECHYAECRYAENRGAKMQCLYLITDKKIHDNIFCFLN
jgi:hypothetical protein